MNFRTAAVKNCPICTSSNIAFHHTRSDDRYGYIGAHKIFRCRECSTYFLQNPIHQDDLGKLYEQYYPSLQEYKPTVVHSIAHTFPILLSIFRRITGSTTLIETLPKGVKVLDVGCGFYTELKNEIERLKLQWYGLEINEDIVSKIREQGLSCYSGTPLTALIEEKFDFILLSQVIEHQFDVVANIKALQKVLKKNGRIIIITPNTDSKYLKQFGLKWLHWHTPYHIVLFNRKSIGKLAERCDMEIESYQTYTPTLWYVLQQRFQLIFGKKNYTVAGTIGILSLLFYSVFLRITDRTTAYSNDCMYCILKLK